MDLSIWLSLLGACVVISLTPGAGAVNTMTTALLYGWSRTLWTILGQQAALIVQIAIVAAGVGVIVSNSPLIFDTIRYAGAAYLVYLGLRMLLTQPANSETQQSPAPPRQSKRFGKLRHGSPTALFRQGFWVNMSNPKAIVFILAFTPQFLTAEKNMLPQYAILMATMVATDIVVMWGGFAVIARSLTKFSQTAHGQNLLNKTFGVLFIAVAGLLVFSSH
ncbi:MAG: LysE family transporter [Corynebacterium sp.]|nr:LysE family transporter [Corynebacterium sp.]